MARTARDFGKALMLAGVITFLPADAARADAAMLEPIKVSVRIVKAPVSQVAGFDWLAKRRAAPQVIRASADASPRQLGQGSWICSPAGFGKRSRCYAN